MPRTCGRAPTWLRRTWPTRPTSTWSPAGSPTSPWEEPDLTAQDAILDATELTTAEKAGNRTEIFAVERDIKDHLAEGPAGQAFLTAFYNQAAPHVAALAGALYTQDETIKQPLTAADDTILKTFATAYIIRYEFTPDPGPADARDQFPAAKRT